MNTIICELFNNPENKKFFKRLPQKIVGASNVFVIKMNYNYTNQNACSYLNSCIFKCDVDTPTCDDIDIIVNVLPNITYSNQMLDNAKKQFKYYDGSWFRLYWNKYLNDWKIATSQLVNGEIASWNGIPIGENFQKYVDTIDKSVLNKESTYFFIYSHPFTTFDPTVTEEHFQYIAEVNNGVIVDNDIFKINDEPIDDLCNVVQMTDTAVNMVIQNEKYHNVKEKFRTDIYSVFLAFYAIPEVNASFEKALFELSPRFKESYIKFIENPMLKNLVDSIVNFTTSNIWKYFDHMKVVVKQIPKPVFKIWCDMLMRVDPNHKWDHRRGIATPFTNLVQMDVNYVSLLKNEVYVKQILCQLPIDEVMAAL